MAFCHIYRISAWKHCFSLVVLQLFKARQLSSLSELNHSTIFSFSHCNMEKPSSYWLVLSILQTIFEQIVGCMYLMCNKNLGSPYYLQTSKILPLTTWQCLGQKPPWLYIGREIHRKSQWKHMLLCHFDLLKCARSYFYSRIELVWLLVSLGHHLNSWSLVRQPPQFWRDSSPLEETKSFLEKWPQVPH